MSTEGDNGGPIFDFLAKSGFYQEFANDFSESPPPDSLEENYSKELGKLPVRERNGVYALELQVSTASFDLQLDTKLNHGTATMHFPSRRIVDPKSMHFFMDGLLHAAYDKNRYPNINYSPKVKFTIGDRELDYDLRTYWDGSFYEGTLGNPDISEAIYGFDVSPFINMPAFPKLPGLDNPQGFIYGFRLSDDPHEFIRMSHYKASLIDEELVREFLPRNRGYHSRNPGDLEADSEELAGMIKQACKDFPQQTMFGL